MSYISKPSENKSLRPDWDVPKKRNCMRCQSSFESAWAGERICQHCKRSHSWRNGLPMSTGAATHRK